jgi:hypothetical protein
LAELVEAKSWKNQKIKFQKSNTSWVAKLLNWEIVELLN